MALPVHRHRCAPVVMQFHLSERAILGLINSKAVELVIVGFEIFDMHAAAMFLKHYTSRSAVVSDHILNLNVLRTPDGNAIVPNEREAATITRPATALELLGSAIAVDDQMVHQDIPHDAGNGSGRGADDDDRAIGPVGESQNGLGADAANLHSFPVDDDGFTHGKQGRAEDDRPGPSSAPEQDSGRCAPTTAAPCNQQTKTQ